jgi:tyrosyl-tRNA synthetase
MTTFFEELSWRGQVYHVTEGLADLLARGAVTAYIGFDPTAASLHVGSLLTIMGLARLQRFGHRPIALVGGGTGMIGDPSGKSQERVLLTREQIEVNVAGVRAQLARFLAFDGPNAATLVNNADWLGAIDLLTFLRDAGKHFTVSSMMQKDSVSRRLEGEEGISFTEFSYQVLQAYDFLHLYDRFGCVLQMGGSDQWGNITAGTDLIRKLRGVKAHGLVWPLLTTASGAKFGKTESGAVWLDAERTSPFDFYQFWLNTADADVGNYLRYFTFLSRETINDLLHGHADAPEKREAQRALAREVTGLVHGGAETERAERASRLVFSNAVGAMSADEVLAAYGDAPSTELPRVDFDAGVNIVDLMARVGLAPSRSEARRLVQSGAVSVNDELIADPAAKVYRTMAKEERILVLRRGKKHRHLVRLT